MRLFRLVPDGTRLRVYRFRRFGFAVSFALLLLTALALPLQGLNLGIDFLGGILLEVRAEQPVDLARLRADLTPLRLGEIKLQEFGSARDLLIRIQTQPGGAQGAQSAIHQVRTTLGQAFEIRRTEVVGPTVGHEMLIDGIWATVLSLAGIGIYLALRFDWPFAVAALAATAHDVIATVGLFALLGLEFHLTAVAALLTLAGYSINDTVVVFDRIRENLRLSKGRTGLPAIIDDSVDQTLARTLATSVTTLLAVLALVVFAGGTLLNFSLALAFGIAIGTFSSIFVAAALLPPLMGRAPIPIPGAEPTTTAEL